MERICFKLHIRPDRMDEYKERHRNVWPEMLKAIREAGWHNYSLFLDHDGTLIGYFETDNLELSLATIATKEINLRWQSEMAPYFIDLPTGRPDQGLHRLEQVFYTD